MSRVLISTLLDDRLQKLMLKNIRGHKPMGILGPYNGWGWVSAPKKTIEGQETCTCQKKSIQWQMTIDHQQ